jgi:hypothetical protein
LNWQMKQILYPLVALKTNFWAHTDRIVDLPIRIRSVGARAFQSRRIWLLKRAEFRVNPYREQPLVPHLLLDHRHRHTSHERVHHMAVPEDMGRYLPPRELLPARDLLNPGLFCQPVYGPEEVLVLRWPELRPCISLRAKSSNLFHRHQHLPCRRAPLRPGLIRGHSLQVLDIDLAHLEPGNEDAGHDCIAMLCSLGQFFFHLPTYRRWIRDIKYTLIRAI